MLWALVAREGSDTNYAARETTGGLCAGAGPFDQLRAEHRARWRRIFSITVGCSMKAMKGQSLSRKAAAI
jgi:hypothetical protein